MCDTCAEHAHEHTHGEEHHRHGLPQHAHGDDFRVVVTGKGGVGKTTLTAMLARRMSRRGYRVLALDADPQMNLPYALGIEHGDVRRLVPLSENTDYVEEKTGVR
ncbi:MAG: AAA family ATPase, partial [Gammaproteobacteria bacterium]|nr:AAA family ATPase [Gammaproteobacteria bacterium]